MSSLPAILFVGAFLVLMGALIGTAFFGPLFNGRSRSQAVFQRELNERQSLIQDAEEELGLSYRSPHGVVWRRLEDAA